MTFESESERQEYFREGVKLAEIAGDDFGAFALKVLVVSSLLNQKSRVEAEREFQMIEILEGDRTDLSSMYANAAMELGHFDIALSALRNGFGDRELSCYSLYDAEVYKRRRTRLVFIASLASEESFRAEVEKLAHDCFYGIQIPLADLAHLKQRILDVLPKEFPNSVPYDSLRRGLEALP